MAVAKGKTILPNWRARSDKTTIIARFALFDKCKSILSLQLDKAPLILNEKLHIILMAHKAQAELYFAIAEHDPFVPLEIVGTLRDYLHA